MNENRPSPRGTFGEKNKRFSSDGAQGAKKPFTRGKGDGKAKGGYKKEGKSAKLVSRMDARRLALNALADVTRANAYAGLALDKALRSSTLPPEEKRLATSIFYSAVENLLRIDYILKQFVEHMPEPIVEDILRIAAAQLLFMDKQPDHAVVDEAVKQARAFRGEGYTALVNGALRNLIRARDDKTIAYPDPAVRPIQALAVEYSVPEPLVKRLVDDYGIEFARELLAYRPDERWETLRPNRMMMDDNQFSAYLTGRGWEHQPGPVPGSFRVRAAGDLPSDPDYRRGLFSIQGASSMLAAMAVKPQRGMRILDACAAPGGKACLMAEMMSGTGRVYAWDLHEHRVELIRAAKRRLKLDNLRPAAHDASVFRPEMAEEKLDAVLIDAPCSGLGVMINKPDIKYRQNDQTIAGLVEIQRNILEACCQYVKVGGALVYSTCTILPEENVRQVERFLRDHGEFKLDTDMGYLPHALSDKAENGMLQLYAHRDGREGFFIARMIRVGDEA